jgi:acetyl-CoA C-acetyltransferase
MFPDCVDLLLSIEFNAADHYSNTPALAAWVDKSQAEPFASDYDHRTWPFGLKQNPRNNEREARTSLATLRGGLSVMPLRSVSVIGIGSTNFGRQEGQSLIDLACAAANEAIADAGVRRDRIQAFYLGNFASGILVGEETIAPKVAYQLGLGTIPATKVEGACASAGIAVRHGFLLTATGLADVVLVAGAEKMTSATTAQNTAALAAAAEELEYSAGLTFAGAFGIWSHRHMHEFGTTREQLALVSIKNKKNGIPNPRAQFRKEITLDDVLESRLVADPLRLYDCCPISDGAAALVLCATEMAGEYCAKPVEIIGSGQATGSINLYEADSLVAFKATVEAARQAYDMAGLKPADIDVVELHDCFTTAEIIDSEDLGLFEKGRGGPAVEEGMTQIKGKIPINPSGGLLSKGHPVGATGCGQAYEVIKQLRGEHENQVSGAEIGLAHNLGATGAVSTVHIFRRS